MQYLSLVSTTEITINADISPNPSFGRIRINLEEAAKYSITTLDGRTIMSSQLNRGENNLDLDFNPGAYIISFIFDSGITESQKLIII